jgi:hypothetical protein
MARRAFPRAVKKFLACIRISGLEILRRHVLSPALFRIGFRFLVVDERNDGGKILIGKIKRRHALVDSSAVHHGRDFIAANIIGHNARPREVRARLAASGVAAMAKRAILQKDALTGVNLCLWICLRRYGLLRYLRSRTRGRGRRILPLRGLRLNVQFPCCHDYGQQHRENQCADPK